MHKEHSSTDPERKDRTREDAAIYSTVGLQLQIIFLNQVISCFGL